MVQRITEREKKSSEAGATTASLLLIGLLSWAAFLNGNIQGTGLTNFLEKAQVGTVLPDQTTRGRIKAAAWIVQSDNGSCNGLGQPEIGQVLTGRHCIWDGNKIFTNIRVSPDGGTSWIPARSISFLNDVAADFGRVHFEPRLMVGTVEIAGNREVKRGETVFVQSYLSEKDGFRSYLTPVEVMGEFVLTGDTGLLMADLGPRESEVGLIPGRSGSGVFTADGKAVAVVSGGYNTDGKTPNGQFGRMLSRSHGFDETSFPMVVRAHVLEPRYPQLSGLFRWVGWIADRLGK